MFDHKTYSVKEVLDHIFADRVYGKLSTPLLPWGDYSKKRTQADLNHAVLDYTYNDSVYSATLRDIPGIQSEFYIRDEDRTCVLHYINEPAMERLNMSNVSFTNKIDKEGKKKLIKKTYYFSDKKKLFINYMYNEFDFYFPEHRYHKRIYKDGGFNIDLRFNNGLCIVENYNKNKVCTRSSLMIESIGSITVKRKRKEHIVTFMDNNTKMNIMSDEVVLDVEDASVSNLYNSTDTFQLSLVLSTEHYAGFCKLLKVFRNKISSALKVPTGNEHMLRNMLREIEKNEQKYETQQAVLV